MNISTLRKLKEGSEVKVMEPLKTNMILPGEENKQKFRVGKIRHFGRVTKDSIGPKKCHREIATFVYVQGRQVNQWVNYCLLGIE